MTSKGPCSFVYRHSTVREIALMVLMAYLSYTLAEVKSTHRLASHIFIC